jgi:hypothetical protein
VSDARPRPIGRPNPDPDNRQRLAARLVLPDGERLYATTHCVDRFWERAASSESTFHAARARLLILVQAHGCWTGQPAWFDGRVDADVRWLAIGEDVALLVIDGLARTCMTRGAFLRGRRAKRRKWRGGRARGTEPTRPRPQL